MMNPEAPVAPYVEASDALERIRSFHPGLTLRPAAYAEAPVEEISPQTDIEQQSAVKGLYGWLRNNKITTTAGAVAAASLATAPIADTIKTLQETAPYLIGGLAAAEVAWVGGAAMMLTASGMKVGNPLRLKDKMSALTTMARDSKLFRAGFAVNTIAGVAQFTLPTIAVVEHMPVQSWGVLTYCGIDLWITYQLRKAIWQATSKQHSIKE